MNLTNQNIAEMLRQIADLLEVHGENHYRVRAYRRAARIVEKYKDNIADLVAAGRELTDISYIGPHIANKIKIIVETNELPQNLIKPTSEKQFRNELKDIPGLGVKRINLLKTQFNITNKKKLLELIESGELQKLRGFNKNLIKKIEEGIAHPKVYEKKFRLKVASTIAESLKKRLIQLEGVDKVIVASAYRRKADVVGNLEFILISNHSKYIIEQFMPFPEIHELIHVANDSATVILRSGMQITINIIKPEYEAISLLYKTGNKAHVNELEKIASDRHFLLNENGLSQNKTALTFHNEKDVYNALGLQYIPPELRENRGEIEKSKTHSLPRLIILEDIKGDLHSHTNETDGVETLENMVQAAIRKGYEYLAITDHSKRLAITNGLDEKRLLKQIELINKLNDNLKNFTILKSIEVDILEDGNLDLSNDVLKELDICVCSIHSRFKFDRDKQTERIIRAMDNPHFNILGHPTGRLLQSRQPYPLDLEKIMLAAKERNCFLEINAQPSRLDLNDEYCLMGKSLGVKFAISSDAHSIHELDFMPFGINQARRGWLEASDVLNTAPLNELKMRLRRK